MSVKIDNIKIENFRSINKLDIDVNYMTLFVGHNDSGKSNILRALNLFFNEEVNPGEALYFESDHNVHNNPVKKAKEIVVSLQLSIPSSYRDTNGDVVIWEKRWRSDGKSKDEYKGYRVSKNNRGNAVYTPVEIPTRSNLHTLLKRIEYRYVPAIKERSYFEYLRSEIYKTISEVASASFRKSSSSFESSIGQHMNDLTIQIGESLGIETRMAFPNDMSHIFEKLDFLGGENSISLNSRGDGIKARHIPLILKFIADKKMEMSDRGVVPTTFIWGYEEPENNLEISSCMKLADEMWGFMMTDVAQILMTTHSPVFYNLHEKNKEDEEYVSCHHVGLESPSDGTSVIHNANDLDHRMGTMSFMAPKIKIIQKEIREQEERRLEALVLAKDKRAKIFVEGPSDKIIFERALEVFYPDYKEKVEFATKDYGGGHSYVFDMLTSWHHLRKHHKDKPKSAGIVDGDQPGQQVRKEWNSKGGNVASGKCFELCKTEAIKAALNEGFSVYPTLEILYPIDVWLWAEENGKLVARDRKDVYPDKLISSILNGDTDAKDYEIDEKFAVYVKYEFDKDSKIPVAKYLSKKRDNEFSALGSNFKLVLKDVIDYLFE